MRGRSTRSTGCSAQRGVWGGLPAQYSACSGNAPEKNAGKTHHTLTVKDVPVDAFRLVTVYDDQGRFFVNDYDA
jgi:hypothetical protein